MVGAQLLCTFSPQRESECTQEEKKKEEAPELRRKVQKKMGGGGAAVSCALHGDSAVMLPWMQSAYTSLRYKTIPVYLKKEKKKRKVEEK